MVRTSPHLIPTLLAVMVLSCCSTVAHEEQDEPEKPEETGSSVKLWQEPLTLPTYLIGKPDPNPRFYAGRAYQGAQGRVYPYPMHDTLTDTREDRTYNAVYLENEYVKICVLPELGGRVFSALDRTNGYDFLYRQHVVKPALIGLLGAWTSGGIEWNFPHHHRATSFLPVDYKLEEHADGSKTVWVGEMEIRHRMKWIIGITLHPGKSWFEATVKLFNRTPFAHSCLWWANVAVHAGPDYQVIFPPRTEYATYHKKNQFAHWPICREVFKGVDYTRGVDISWWKNHPSPISFFAWNHEDDFLVGYDHGKAAGTAHVADHHRVPGKKFWVWGPGPQGKMWDRILTETDGPYIEVMAGAYSDNQPDYSWMQPHEVKMFKQYWYPIREIGGAKNANLEAAVNLEVVGDSSARIGFNTTSRHKNAGVVVTGGGRAVFEQRIDIGPDQPFSTEVALPSPLRREDLRAALFTAEGEELVAYSPIKKKGAPMPDAVKPPLPPKSIETVEELTLTGQRLEQFHSPALAPDPFYEEALRRDPYNYRAGVALGILLFRRGLFKEAEARFRTALHRVTRNYTSPRDGEAQYYLGLVLKFQDKSDAAYEALGKAAWSQAFHTAASYHLAEIDCTRGDFSTALDHIDRAIATNGRDTGAMNLKAAVLRRLGRLEEAAAAASSALHIDPLDFRAGYERYLARSVPGSNHTTGEQNALRKSMRGEVQSYLEMAVDYGNCGLWEEGIAVLGLATSSGCTHPMLHYYHGYFQEKNGCAEEAARAYRLGNAAPPDYCFPFRLESIRVLHAACRHDPEDARAPYYLGNLLYDHQPRTAIREWEKAVALGSTLSTVHRNLGLAYAQVENDIKKAIASMEKAVACNDRDPRLFRELDILYESGGVSPEKRLALLRKHHHTIVKRDDAFSREILLLTQLGHYDTAIEYMRTHHFRKWEGIGNIHGTFVDAHLLRGKRHLKAGRHGDAIADFEAALEYPENLEVARPYHSGRASQCRFFLGEAYEASGDLENARKHYGKSVSSTPRHAGTALDYYRGLALVKLGKAQKARPLFDRLISTAQKKLKALKAGGGADFFAKFGKRLPLKKRRAHAHYLMGLGFLGRGEQEKARTAFTRALALNGNHLWYGARTKSAE